MSVVVDVHGVDEGTGTHISVFAYMASDGQFDALEFPFKGTVKIELLNQLENYNHHQKSINIEAETREGQG